jgi:hypothetical protein
MGAAFYLGSCREQSERHSDGVGLRCWINSPKAFCGSARVLQGMQDNEMLLLEGGGLMRRCQVG